MLELRPHKVFAFIFAVVLLTYGCRTETRPPAADSSSAAENPEAEPSAAPATNGWNEDEAGPLLLVSVSEAVRQASVVIPGLNDIHSANDQLSGLDSVRGNEFDLFDRSGHVGVATLESISPAPAEGCAFWPVGTFRDVPSRSWRVGFGYRKAKALKLDSLEAMKSTDSSAVTIELARLSSLATVNGDPAFAGLPFTVREAYRMEIPEASVIIGDVVRTINEEANPREEHLLLVAEKEGGSSTYHTAYYSRSAGSEDEVRTSEVLTAVRFVGTNRPALVVLFGFADGERTVLLERFASDDWKASWRSAYSGC